MEGRLGIIKDQDKQRGTERDRERKKCIVVYKN